MPDLVKKWREQHPYLSALEDEINADYNSQKYQQEKQNEQYEQQRKEYEQWVEANQYGPYGDERDRATSRGVSNALTPEMEYRRQQASGGGNRLTPYQVAMQATMARAPETPETRSNTELRRDANRQTRLAAGTTRMAADMGNRLTQDQSLIFNPTYTSNLRTMGQTMEEQQNKATQAQAHYQAVKEQRKAEEAWSKYSPFLNNPDFLEMSKPDPNNENRVYYSMAHSKEAIEENGANVNAAAYATDDEKRMYYYLWNTQGSGAANAYYYNYVEHAASARKAVDVELRTAARIQNNGFLGDVRDSFKSIGTNAISGIGIIDIALQNIGAEVSTLLGLGDPGINYYSLAQMPGIVTDAIRSNVAKKIAESTPGLTIGKAENAVNIASFFYETGMSMADSTAMVLMNLAGVPEWLTLANMGTAAGTRAVRDAKERGASDWQALAFGISSAIMEALFEKASLDSILKPSDGKFFKNAAKQTFVEGSEEFFTTWGNTMMDQIIMGDKSELFTRERQLMEQGYSQKDALKKAALEWCVQIGSDAFAGMLSGFGMGGAKEVGTGIGVFAQGVRQDMQTARALTDYQNAQQAAPQIAPPAPEQLTVPPQQTQSARQADPLGYAMNKAAQGETVTKSDARAIIENPQALQALRDSGVLTGEVKNESAGRQKVVDAVNALAERNTQTAEENVRLDQETAQNAAPTENESQQEVQFAQETAQERTTPPLPRQTAQEQQERVFTPPLPQNAQNEAQEPTLRVRAQEEQAPQQQEALRIRENEVAEPTQQAPLTIRGTNATVEENRQEVNNNVDIQPQAQAAPDSEGNSFYTRARQNAAGRQGIDGSERRSGVGRLLQDLRNYRTVRGAESRASAADRIGAEADVRNQREVSAKDLDVGYGTDNKTARLLDNDFASRQLGRNWDRAVAEYAKMGVKLQAITGQLERQLPGGQPSMVRAYVSGDGKTITVQADHPTLTWNQLLDHEELHRLIKSDAGYKQQVMEALLADEKLKPYLADVFERYAQKYKSVDPGMTTNEIAEELLADYRAGFDMLDPLGLKNPTTAMAAKTAAKDIKGVEKERYKTNGGRPAPRDITETFAEGKNSVEPPYRLGTKAAQAFEDGLNEQARSVYDMFLNVRNASLENTAVMTVGAGKKAHPKRVTIADRFLTAADWNDQVKSDPEFAQAAKNIFSVIPESIRKNARLNDDGTISETEFEKRFKMARSLVQRLVDALPKGVVGSTVELDGKSIQVARGRVTASVGGEEYRRALIAEKRRLYEEGSLPTRAIGTLSHDNWGAMGFLATNTKTIASGDFTTFCPQMYFNDGCWYCYRRAALTSGVNNKLTAETVWYAGEILQLRQADIDRLNQVGGLRIQSFGDWMTQYSTMLADMLIDAEKVGLQIKIITKEPSMIDTVALLKEQGLGKSLYFNLSADYTIEKRGKVDNTNTSDALPMNPERPFMQRENESGEEETWWKRALTVQEANEYRKMYPWVNTRIVATNLDEFIRGLSDPTVDVVTGYHGDIRQQERVSSETGETLLDVEPLGDAGMPRFAYDRKTGEWTLEYEGKSRYQKQLAQRIQEEGLEREYYTKSCCIFGRCAKCQGKCGSYARSFAVKNATNRDQESVKYWQREMESGVDNPLLESQQEGKTSTEIDDDYLFAVNWNDAQTAREMVQDAAKQWGAATDENGKLVELYHGTKKPGFTAFDTSKQTNGRAGLIYTTTSKKVADSYGGSNYRLYGNLGSNPLEIEGNKRGFDLLQAPELFGDDAEHHIDEIARKAREEGYTALVVRNVFDGPVMADDYIFFNSNQLKSAEPVAYDDDGNVIPLSERFNAENEDIRYSTEMDAPYNRTALLTEDTVDRWLKDYASESSPKYAQAYITRMSPDQFLKLTTSRTGRLVVSSQTGPMEAEKLIDATQKQPLQLIISNGEVVGHEGRHRATALDRANVRSIPVLVFDSSNKNSKTDVPEMVLQGQDFGSSRSYDRVTLEDMIPLSYENRDRIVQEYGKQDAFERSAEKLGYRQTMKFSTEIYAAETGGLGESDQTFTQKYQDFMEKISKNGYRWNGHEFDPFYYEHPEYDFVQRFFDGDKAAKTDLQKFLSGITDIKALDGMSWYTTQNHWTRDNVYRGAITKVRNQYKARIKELQAQKAGGRKVELKHGQLTFDETRNLFEELNSNEAIGKLAEKVFSVAEKLDLNVYATNRILGQRKTNIGGTNLGGDVWLRINSFADPSFTDQQKATWILHELIHACTSYAMRDSYRNSANSDPQIVEAVDQLESMYQQAQAEPSLKGEYGLTSYKEFIAELANPRFREKLEKVSLWDRIIDALRRFFGIEKDNLLTGASAALDYMLDNMDMEGIRKFYDIAERQTSRWEQDNNDTRYSIEIDPEVAAQFSPEAIARRQSNRAKGVKGERKVSRVRSNTYEYSGLYNEVEAQMDEADEENYTYDPVSEKKSMNEALGRLKADFDGEVSRLSEADRQWGGSDLDTAMGILHRYRTEGRATGDYGDFWRWSKVIQEKGTKGGQFIQAFAKYTRTGTGAAMKGAKDIHDRFKLNPAQQKQVDAAKKRLMDGIDGDMDGAAQDAMKQAKGKKEPTKKQDGKVDKKKLDAEVQRRKDAERLVREISKLFEKQQDHGEPVENWLNLTGEELARKISGRFSEPKQRTKTTMQTILSDLVGFAEEHALPDRKKAEGTKRTAIDIITDYLNNRDAYGTAWAAAQSYLRAAYTDDQEKLDALNSFLTATIAYNAEGTDRTMLDAILHSADVLGISEKRILELTSAGATASTIDRIGDELVNQVKERMGADYDESFTQQLKDAARRHITGIALQESAEEQRLRLSGMTTDAARQLEMNLQKLLTQSRGDKNKAAQSVADYLIRELGIPSSDAAIAAERITGAFMDELASRADRKLQQMFAEKKPKTQEQRDKLLDLIRLGGLTNSNVEDAVVDALGIGGMSRERQRELVGAMAQFGETLDAMEADDLDGLKDLIRAQAAVRNTPLSRQAEKALAGETDAQYLWEFALAQLDAIAGDFAEMSPGAKISTFQTISHLLNMRTALRNLTSNQVFDLVDSAANNLATIPDMVIGAFTGKRTVGVNKSWLSEMKRVGAKQGAARNALEVRLDVSPDDRQKSKYGTAGRRTNSMVASNAFGRILSHLEEVMGYELNTTDEFHKGSVRGETLESLARFVERGDITQEQANAWAEEEALYRSFQDDTLVGNIMGELKTLLNVIGFGDSGKTNSRGRTIHDFGLGDLVVKYTQVPGALIHRGIEYSPLGYAKMLYDLAIAKDSLVRTQKRGEDVTNAQRKLALDIGRATTGSGLITLFAVLAKAGLLRRDDDDKDKNAKAMHAAQGLSGTQLNLTAMKRWIEGGDLSLTDGDVLADIGFLEPLDSLMTIATLMANDDDLKLTDIGVKSLDGVWKAISNTSAMQTISNIISTVQYHDEENDLPLYFQIPIEIASDSISGFVPSPVRQLAQATDTTYRDQYRSKNLNDQIRARVANSIPGLRQTLAPKITPLGEDRKYQKPLLNYLNATLNPGNINVYQGSGVVDELNRVYGETDDAKIWPERNAPYSFTANDEKWTLTPDERTQYQRTRGQTTANAMESVMGTDWYKSMGAIDQAEVLNWIGNFSNFVAKKEMLESRGQEYGSTTYNKYYEAWQSGTPIEEVVADKYGKLVKAAEETAAAETIIAEAKIPEASKEEAETMSADAKRYYAGFLKGGVSDETARKLATELDGSEASGHEQWRMVYDAAGKEGEKAVTSVMTDDMKRNWNLAKDAGVSMDDYIKVREGFKDLNGNGKQTQDEWNTTLDSYTFSTNEAKDKSIKGTLWQILTGSGSTKNNPYDKEAGQKVIDAKANGGSGSGSGSYAPARIPTLRIPAAPTVSKPSSGLRIRATTPAAQAPRSDLRIKAQ